MEDVTATQAEAGTRAANPCASGYSFRCCYWLHLVPALQRAMWCGAARRRRHPPPTPHHPASPDTAAGSVVRRPVQRVQVSADDDPSWGNADAPVTIIEFSDFQCPYCRVFYQTTLVTLLERYPKQVRFVYRDFPLASIHPQATLAAEASQCAHAQGRFWEFHNAVFANIDRLGPDLYQSLAISMGLDKERFAACVNSREFSAEVEKDFNDARALGVTGTPTFFINGIPLVGAQPLEAFAQIIEQELSQK
ncbi:Na(+)/H(+) antiporter NhaA 2 [Anaerolineaceae bacterium]|nr:Na(+)/H(+) antiporter NhaA 2 [Anaerolineaceae bacterium]